jgi:hypothetical protein
MVVDLRLVVDLAIESLCLAQQVLQQQQEQQQVAFVLDQQLEHQVQVVATVAFAQVVVFLPQGQVQQAYLA